MRPVLLSLVFLVAPALAAPSDPQPAVQVAPNAPVAPPAASLEVTVKEVEESLKELRTKLLDTVSAIGAPADSSSFHDPKVTFKEVEESLKKLRTKLQDAVSAGSSGIAETEIDVKRVEESLNMFRADLQDAVSSIVAPANNAELSKDVQASVDLTIPQVNYKPTQVTTNKKYSVIIGQFITDLIQIPIVLLHAFGEVIAGLTGIKQPEIVYSGSSAGTVSVGVPPPPYKVDSPKQA